MPQAIIYFGDEESVKIEEFSKNWNLSKMETVKKMVREFKEVENESVE